MDLAIMGAMRQLNLPPAEHMTPRDRLPLGKDCLALGVGPMADERRRSLVEAREGAASRTFTRRARYFSHLWQPGCLRETRGFAPPLRRRFALDKYGNENSNTEGPERQAPSVAPQSYTDGFTLTTRAP